MIHLVTAATAVVPSPSVLAFGAGARSLVACLVSVARTLRRVSTSRPLGELHHLAQYAVEHYGEKLLSAESRDDLDDLLDTLIEDPALLHLSGLMLRVATPDMIGDSLGDVALAELAEDVFGHGQRQLLEEGDQLVAGMIAAVMELVGTLSDEEQSALSAQLTLVSAATLWTDPDTPAEVAHAVVSGMRASVCTCAIVHALAQSRPLEPWLARALLERWVSSARAYLQMLAALAPSAVEEALIPANERLDIARLEAAATRARHESDSVLAQARKIGG